MDFFDNESLKEKRGGSSTGSIMAFWDKLQYSKETIMPEITFDFWG